ncbi:MAG: HEPN domain-containing protein [Thaumarchaeota archaeon]|nr:HEPN domain-containing protein [Candidatus Geocrenenecus arthurdayi]MCL7388803.1 HEPN domain-containing protein [Candidatus Geocrenenecus arthurdayi]MCL7391424.1 HEPN domain-containing protein [Candidatus Geocrenenecus arthurdayi]MCL7397116.1 HEPN domain-containing protein [Candidatus Geocrenenecus arthurdayi]MCL7402474.1 HEPN domain-containing protein [Candidatus Geocrenenecus arthurdayi]
MNNLEMAENYIKQAKTRIKYAELALREEEYPYVMRQSQESVELALKAALRLVGIEPPKWHDVGPILKEYSDRFPEWFKREIDEVAGISRELRREREPSMYGDEETSTPPYKLYSRRDAEKALLNARKVLELCEKLLIEWVNQRRQ